MNARLRLFASGSIVLAGALCVSTTFARSLTIDERIAAQRAIEQVYWNHRIWPKENPTAKPPLSAVMSDAAIRAKVESYLGKSVALETWWRRPISDEQLQAELNRMASGSRDPSVLKELFSALGNDPLLIAETLARQTLADRMIRTWYANDTRFHGRVRARAEAALAACSDVDCMRSMGGEYRELTLQRRNRGTDPTDEPENRGVLRLDLEDWKSQLERLAASFGTAVESMPVRRLSALDETDDAFVVLAVRSRGSDDLATSSVSWPKRSFDAWWEEHRGARPLRVAEGSRAFTLPDVPTAGCGADLWSPMAGLFVEARFGHTAVWTGSEMVIWGGAFSNSINSPANTDTGGRYNPSTGSWLATSTASGVPQARALHTAVWTGTEMIVWGGQIADSTYVASGGRYNPSTDSWVATSTAANAPSARRGQTAVWTGTSMVVWGGTPALYVYTNTGGRYDPASDNWSPTSVGPNVPSARTGHTAVWTGAEMIVWGGKFFNPQNNASTYFNSGGRYNPISDTWSATPPSANVPTARAYHVAVWTGSEMIVWGGYSYDNFVDQYLNSGGRYDPSTDSWTATSVGAGVPTARELATGVWTGSEMIVWGGSPGAGGYANTGGRYRAATNDWTALSTGPNVPSARIIHTAVWTGSEMIVWGGYSATGHRLGSGGRYSPTTDAWVPTSTGRVPDPRFDHTAVWTGAEMIVWGGSSYNTGGRYTPSTNTWTPTSTGTNVPAGRGDHSAVWTGTEMIVWGGAIGLGNLSYFNSGGRYDPATDTWLATSTGPGTPIARRAHTAVWTGTEMIVWGGAVGTYDQTNTGGRYSPSADSWTATSIAAGTPGRRFEHTAVWTGSRMIVWGGSLWLTDFSFVNTGGIYDPSTNSWTATPTGANAPSARGYHSAVWTGTEMIVWGGRFYSTIFNTGGRYDPSTNGWTATSTGPDVPTPRLSHTAVWTDTEMIVWGGGGEIGHDYLNTGGRYRPDTDSWTATSASESSVPAARLGHTAVWTGDGMIVWGGDAGYALGSGGRYCGCANGVYVYRDADGDGYGDPASPFLTCDGTPVVGYVADATDCRDTDAAIHPGAPEVCNGVDDDCDTVVDEDVGQLLYFDFDRDGYGNPAQTQFSCFPPYGGWILQGGDCNDANPAIHPGAPEVCNGIDDDCDLGIDNAAPEGMTSLTMTKLTAAGSCRLDWSTLPTAQDYDATRGSLGSLRSSAGNFTSSTNACLGNDMAGTTVTDAVSPPAGLAFWYLIRGVNYASAGSYDDPPGSQAGARDAEIDSAPSACP